MNDDNITKTTGLLRGSKITMNAELSGKADTKDAGRAMIIAYTLASFGLMGLLLGAGALLACWGLWLLA